MVTIKTPAASLVRFDESGIYPHCVAGDVMFALPIYDDDDYAFQFILEADTEAEADALAAIDSTAVSIGIISTTGTLLQSYDSDQPERFRLSPKQILYNWIAGFPGFTSVVSMRKCFKVQVTVNSQKFSSNLFQRIPKDCFTSVIEYSSDDNSFGFNYCASGVIDPDAAEGCQPTEISFVNETNITIPYTAQMQQAYGPTPTVQVWIQDGGGNLVNSGIQAVLDAYPPNTLSFDFGGVASGLIVLK